MIATFITILLGEIIALGFCSQRLKIAQTESLSPILSATSSVSVPLCQQWPWTSDPLIFSNITLFGNSSVSTSAGSSNALDLVSAQAKTLSTALRVTINSNSYAQLKPTGTGYLFLTGEGVQATWQGRNSREELVPMSLGLTAAYASIDIGLVVDTITFSSSSNTRLNLFSIRIWSDQYDRPSYGKYVMQPFLVGHSAFSLAITSLNNTFKIYKTSAPSNEHTIHLVRRPLSTYNINSLAPDDFIDVLQYSIDFAIGQSKISVYLQSYDYNRPDMLHVANLVWQNHTTDSYSVHLPSSVAADQVCATSATLGLYTFDGTSATTVNLDLAPVSSTISPSAAIIQWPVTWTMLQNKIPGSADTDGIVNIYCGSDTEPSLVLDASNFTYDIHAPLSTLGPYSGIFTPADEIIEMTVAFDTLAATQLAETCSSIGLTIVCNQICLDFITAFMSAVTVAVYDNDTSTGLIIAYFDGFVGANCLFTSLPALNQTVTIQIPVNVNPAIPQFNMPGTIGSVRNLSIQILDGRLGSVLYGIDTPILMSADIVCDSPLGFNTDRYALDSAPSIFSSTTLRIEAWAGGGGSLLDGPVPYYGGASSRVSMVVLLPNYLKNLIVDSGTKGVQINDSAASGGRPTRVSINGTTIFQIGSGGGAGYGSNGGCGGGPTQSRFGGALTSASYWQGFSGSTAYFDPASNPQVLGTDEKPDSDIITSGTSIITTEIFQGSGACNILDDALDGTVGSSGYIMSSGTRHSALNGGLGGLGINRTVASKSYTSGGTGCSNGLLFGGGGGGATGVLNAETINSDLEIASVTVNGPWYSFSDSTKMTLGGGFGPLVVPTVPGTDFYTPITNFCDNVSLTSMVMNHVWSKARQTSWTTNFLTATAVYVGGAGASLSVPNTSHNLIYSTDDAFVNFGEPSNAASLESYLPLGPHDLYMPELRGPNIRPMTGETALFEDNTILCIYNDGQINFDEVPFLLDTLITGPEVPAYTTVVNISFGQSQPLQSFSCIYLTLSKSLLNSNGPFIWHFRSSSSLFLKDGTYIQVSELKPAPVWYDQNLQMSLVSQALTNDFVNSLYAAMPHMHMLRPGLISETWFPETFTLPTDDVGGPTYLSKIWPCTNSTENNKLRVRVYLRHLEVMPDSLGHMKTEYIFNTGSTVDYTIPQWATNVNAYVYGAAGTSASENTRGSRGTCCIASFDNLAGRRLVLEVGQGGGHTLQTSLNHGGYASPSTSMAGGLSSIKDFLSGLYLVVAAGGGAGGTRTSGVSEFETSQLDGRTGVMVRSRGQNVADLISGPGGAGLRGGSCGTQGRGGGSGSSIVPKGGLRFTNLVGLPYYNSNISDEASNFNAAGHGLIVLELMHL